ncbi:MAG: septal ring lytic transglycosylase RlpA family protein [Nitrospirae bacterium]|nr:septal ring lytic transglycosylase RlpA family protein [Nitrospirota bacterium]
MRGLKKVLLIVGLIPGLIGTGCISSSSLRHPEPGQRFSAVASWYGEPFHGRPTASGERFDMHGFTAAHRSLPFGTRLKVTDETTGRSAIVTVNDRGPFVRGRQMDLSYGAAREIGLVGEGVGRVSAEVLDRDLRYQKRVVDEADAVTTASTGSFAIQFGAFRDPENAGRLKQALELESKDVSITQTVVDGAIYHRVRLGPFASRAEAIQRARAFADEGYDTLIVSR